MFSSDKFYNILHDNLVSQITELNGQSIYFYPFGTYDNSIRLPDNSKNPMSWAFWHFVHCYFFDQEPFYENTKTLVEKYSISGTHIAGPRRINILANSEKSDIKRNFVKSQNYYDWYYFFHGFAALDWYRDFQYLTPGSFNNFDKVFICYNHLTSNLRSYRLHLVSNLIAQGLNKHGLISLFHNGWENTIVDPNNPLDNRARVTIYNVLKNIKDPLTIDTNIPTGALSASINLEDSTSALFHIVTETIYFDPKLHLTEKIFKPIVAKRPFILVAAPGNLAYLKSYGFRTFDYWIDESYDLETDHYIRIEKITAEIARLCAMDPAELKQMHQEMQTVLEYNFNHFYGKFKNIIVDELVDNFEHIFCQINNGRQPGNHSRYHQRFELDTAYLEQVKKRLKQ